MTPMSDTVQKLAVAIGAALSVGAVTGVFMMWTTLNRMEAAEQEAAPLRTQLRQLETEQLRQGLLLNSQKIDVTERELRELEVRVRALEDRG